MKFTYRKLRDTLLHSCVNEKRRWIEIHHHKQSLRTRQLFLESIPPHKKLNRWIERFKNTRPSKVNKSKKTQYDGSHVQIRMPELKRMKNINQLEGVELAYWVARALKYKNIEFDDDSLWIVYGLNDTTIYGEPTSPTASGRRITATEYRPDINGCQAFDLLETEFITGFWIYQEGRNVYCVEYGDEEKWVESVDLKIAICRAVVMAVYGDYVEEIKGAAIER